MKDVLENIKSRRSIRKYKNEQINDEQLNKILEAGQYAPSGGNSQSWHFIVIQNKCVLQELNKLVRKAFKEVIIEENTYKSIKAGKVAAENEKYNFYYNAPTLIVVTNAADYGNAMADSACAIENMLLTANYLELGACWINQLRWFGENNYVKDVLKKIGMPEGYSVFGALSVGYSEGVNLSNKSIKGNSVTFVR